MNLRDHVIEPSIGSEENEKENRNPEHDLSSLIHIFLSDRLFANRNSTYNLYIGNNLRKWGRLKSAIIENLNLTSHIFEKK